MTDQYLTDPHGHSIHIVNWKGKYLSPETTAEHMEAVGNMEVRSDDVLVCGYPRSGSHWVLEIVKMLLAGKAEPMNNSVQDAWLETTFGPLEKMATLPSPRVFVSHFPFSDLPVKFRERRCKIVNVERDFKDVAVSYYMLTKELAPDLHEYHGEWNGFFSLFLRGHIFCNSWFDHVKSYRKLVLEDPGYPIIRLMYKDLKKEPIGELERLSQFLGLPEDRKLLENVARMTEFSSMKAYKDAHKAEGKMFTSGKNQFYRKGIVGDWKNWFTVAQSETYDAEYERQMGHKYEEGGW